MNELINENTIANLYSKRLLNKLQQYDLLTLQNIQKISIEHFATFGSVGKKTVNEFAALKEAIKNSPEAFIKKNVIQQNTDFGISDDLALIKLNILKDSVPNKLNNIFKNNGFITISDIVNISIEDFKKLDSVGVKTIALFEDLISKIISKPEEIINEAIIYSPKEIPSSYNNNIVEGVESFLAELFDELDDNKGKDVIYKRFGLFGNNIYTLEEIGLYYGVTRERIRQIEENNLNKIKTLLEGHSLRKPYLKINSNFLKDYEIIKEQFSKDSFLSEKDIGIVFQSDYGISIQSNPAFSFLLDTIDFKKAQFEEINYFYRDEIFDNKSFDEECRSVISFLQQYIKPITMFDLVITLSRNKKSINKSRIEDVISFLPCIEEIEIQKEEYFQIQFDRLTSLKDMAYRILLEYKDEMHASDIFREIQHRLVLHNQKSRETIRSLKGQLVLDDRFKPIGKTGKWVLTEWNLNTQSIIELVINAFHHYNHPCTNREIIEYINLLRTDIRSESIPSILLQHKSKFLKIDRGTYILKEWQNSYPDAKEIGEEVDIITSFILKKYLVEIFESQKFKPLSLYDLQKKLEEKDVIWSDNYCYLRLSKCDYLRTEKIGKKNYYSINITDQDKNISPRLGKLQKLKIDIENYIQKSKKRKILLSEIVSSLEKKGEIRANIYSVISKHPNIFKKIKEDGKIYIDLQGFYPDIKKEKKDIEFHTQNIAKGENKNIEFKSTLRWDTKLKKLNKDLEFIVIKAIAAFLNTDGGILYIGVEDNGQIYGVEDDIKTLGKKNEDGFILHINNLLTNYFDKSIFIFVEHYIVEIADKKICVVNVKTSNKPVYLQISREKLFVIRGAASVQVLDIEEANLYIKQKWK